MRLSHFAYHALQLEQKPGLRARGARVVVKLFKSLAWRQVAGRRRVLPRVEKSI
jgi:hypothetical protein